MKKERKPGPRTAGAPRDYGKPHEARAPRFRDGERPPRPSRFRDDEGRPPREFGDPYQRVQRPPRSREEGGRGFTVTLDPDVARVFRGDASVNKALRLVMQLMQVVQGPSAFRTGTPRAYGERARPPRPGYQGSAEARGFTRKPRFEEEEKEGTEE